MALNLVKAPKPVLVQTVGEAHLPTRFGTFRIVGFENDVDGKEHIALVHGDIEGQAHVLTRLHSECLTGDALGSMRCDCRDQLEAALKRVAAAPCGIVLYMRQEGRGIGLLNKIRAYALQDEGLDTVDANRALGFGDDERNYAVAAKMLEALGVESVDLMTNNPDKIQQLEHFGVTVAAREPHQLPSNRHNRAYLATKRERCQHMLVP